MSRRRERGRDECGARLSTDRGGWAWASKLGGFTALFVGLGILFAQLAVWVGIPVQANLDWGSVFPPFLAALGASWILTTRFERRSLGTLGLPTGASGATQLGWGTLAGLALMGAVLLVFAALRWITWETETGSGSAVITALELFGLLALAAFAEELLFRGYPFQVVQRRFGSTVAILGTATGFGALHVLNPGIGPLALVNITLAGVLLGVAYWRTGSLWFATGIHVGWNWVMAVSELSVSGIETRMPGFEPVLSGPVSWTGGAFGPEGGFVVTIVSVLGIWWMWRMGGGDENLSSPRDHDRHDHHETGTA